MPLQALKETHETASAQFGKLSQAGAMLDQARQQLTSLTRLGDMVTSEDVIKAAGRLVAAGLSPMAMAKLLSDMPSEGPQLQNWLGEHVAQISQREAQLAPVLAAARHDLGVSAMRSLMGHSAGLPEQGSPGASLGPASAGPAGGLGFTVAAGPAGNSLAPEQPNSSIPIG